MMNNKEPFDTFHKGWKKKRKQRNWTDIGIGYGEKSNVLLEKMDEVFQYLLY